MKKLISVLFAVVFVSFVTAPAIAQMLKDLPKGVVKVSGVVPGMGEHWMNPKNRPFGPIYGVMNGKVVFYEIEVLASDVMGNKGWEKELPVLKKMGHFDHMDIEYLPKGHRGMKVPHFAVHAYTVSHEVHKKYRPKKRMKK